MAIVTGFRDLESKRAEGKLSRRIVCDRCGAGFHFTEAPRVSRSPRCPTCGSFGGHALAA